MNYITHMLFGLLFYTIAVVVGLVPSADFIVFSLFIIGSLLPDIDHPNSYLNNRVKITKAASYVFKHRGFTHTIEFALIVSTLLYIFVKSWVYSLALFLGVFSHIVADSLTVSGVNLFFVKPSFKVRGPFRTNSSGEIIVDVLVILIILLIIAKYGKSPITGFLTFLSTFGV